MNRTTDHPPTRSTRGPTAANPPVGEAAQPGSPPPGLPAPGSPGTSGTPEAEGRPGPPGRPPAPDLERLARAALSRLAEPGDPVVGRWLAELDAPALLRAIRDDRLPGHLAAEGGRLAGYRRRLVDADPRRDLDRVQTLGGRFIIPGDIEWPSQLDDLGTGRPVGLWVLGTGSLRLLALRSVAVVGSRACTAYGAHVAGELAAQLAERGWVVVSGAAYGIDAAAHRGVLAVGGMTVGVLACGVDMAYPQGNAQLIRRISQQGLLVSELPPGEHPNRFRFVLRNRVIAALTRGTVVVEAAMRSGALSTARRARDLNRHTMGLPGPVTSELSAGVHALIRSGDAALVTDAADVGELIGAIGDDLAPEQSGPVLPRDLLEPGTARVLEAVPATPDGAPVERLARHSGLPPDEVLQRLYELVSLEFVERHGAHWRLVRKGGARRGSR